MKLMHAFFYNFLKRIMNMNMNEYEYIKNQASSRSLLLEFLYTGAHLLKNQYLKNILIII